MKYISKKSSVLEIESTHRHFCSDRVLWGLNRIVAVVGRFGSDSRSLFLFFPMQLLICCVRFNDYEVWQYRLSWFGIITEMIFIMELIIDLLSKWFFKVVTK